MKVKLLKFKDAVQRVWREEKAEFSVQYFVHHLVRGVFAMILISLLFWLVNAVLGTGFVAILVQIPILAVIMIVVDRIKFEL